MRTSQYLRTLLAGWMLGTGRCVTSQMWNDANETAAKFEQIRGDVAVAGHREIVVGYLHNRSERPVILIALPPSGEPSPPFAYTGHATSADAILKDISPSQRASIFRAAGEMHDICIQACTQPSAGLMSVESSCVSTASDGTLVLAAYKIVGGHVVVINLPWDPSVPSHIEGWSHPGDYRPPIDGYIVVVPSQRARLAKARTEDQLRAAAFTPVTLAIDAFQFGTGTVLYPILFVIYRLTGAHGC